MVIRVLPLLLAIAGLGAMFGATQFRAAADSPTAQSQGLAYKVSLPYLSKDGATIPQPPTATPTAVPTPYQGAISAMYLPSMNLNGQWVIERRHTFNDNGRERFQDPTHPARIAWYDQFGQPGTPGANSLLAAHVDYVNYGPGPFHLVTSAQVGDTLTLVMDNGIEYAYSVQSVQIINLNDLDMDAIVFPDIPANRERITLISCGGTFVPYPGGGGEYNSRVILVAERQIP